jgi:hypothetical protein
MKFHSCLWEIAYKIGGCPRVRIPVMLLDAFRKWHNINKCRLYCTFYSESSKVFISTLGVGTPLEWKYWGCRFGSGSRNKEINKNLIFHVKIQLFVTAKSDVIRICSKRLAYVSWKGIRAEPISRNGFLSYIFFLRSRICTGTSEQQ